MQKYRIETLERWAMRVVYEFDASNLPDALSDVQAGDAQVLTHEHLGDDPASVEFISAERIDGDPVQAAAPVGEMATLYRRLGKPTPKPAEVKPYTVVLLVPGELQEKAGCPEVFVGHPFAISARAAFVEAQHMAFVERDAPDNNENAFELLAVFEGHHDELLLDDGPPPTSRQSPKPVQELKRVADQLSNDERIRLINVIQKLLWWDAAGFCWNRDLPASLATLDFVADVLDRAGLRPSEIVGDNH
jgi:hypothetical protein